MSIKAAVAGALLFLGSIVLAYYLQVEMGGDVYSKRSPSSEQDIHLKSLKSEILKHRHGHSHIHTEKLRGPLKISLSGPEDASSLKSDTIPLILSIESDEDLPSVQIKWHLPDGVQLVGGRLEETVSIQAGVPKELNLYVQTMDHRNHQIHVHATSAQGTFQFVEVAQYNTVFEPYLRAEKETLQKATVDNEESTTVLKVFQ